MALKRKQRRLPEWAYHEKLYSLTELTLLPNLPHRVSRRMMYEYVTVGIRNWQGVQVRLDYIRVGKKYMTSLERYWAFIEDCSI